MAALDSLTFTEGTSTGALLAMLSAGVFVVVALHTVTYHITIEGAGLYFHLIIWGRMGTVFLYQSTALTNSADKVATGFCASQ